jgi:hypothetical protein
MPQQTKSAKRVYVLSAGRKCGPGPKVLTGEPQAPPLEQPVHKTSVTGRRSYPVATFFISHVFAVGLRDSNDVQLAEDPYWMRIVML